MEFFNKVIELVFWAIAAGGFIYMVIGGMSLSKAIKAKNAADQEDATYGLGAGFIVLLIGLGCAVYFPAVTYF